MTLPTFWVSPYLKCSPAKKWSTRKKQFHLPANGRLEGLLLPLKGLLNLYKEDRLRLFENRICRGDWIATYTTTSTHNTATTNIAVTTTTIFESTLKSLESQAVLSPGRERGSLAICEEWIQPESVWQNKKSPGLNFFVFSCISRITLASSGSVERQFELPVQSPVGARFSAVSGDFC